MSIVISFLHPVNGIDLFGLNALPSGFLGLANIYEKVGTRTYFWTSTSEEYGEAWNRNLNDYSDQSSNINQ